MKEKILFWEALFVISSVPARNYLFKASNWSTRKRCQECSRLRIKELERCRWCHPSAFIVNCEHISNFLIIVDFQQANVCWVYVGKASSIVKWGYLDNFKPVYLFIFYEKVLSVKKYSRAKINQQHKIKQTLNSKGNIFYAR